MHIWDKCSLNWSLVCSVNSRCHCWARILLFSQPPQEEWCCVCMLCCSLASLQTHWRFICVFVWIQFCISLFFNEKVAFEFYQHTLLYYSTFLWIQVLQYYDAVIEAQIQNVDFLFSYAASVHYFLNIKSQPLLKWQTSCSVCLYFVYRTWDSCATLWNRTKCKRPGLPLLSNLCSYETNSKTGVKGFTSKCVIFAWLVFPRSPRCSDAIFYSPALLSRQSMKWHRR